MNVIEEVYPGPFEAFGMWPAIARVIFSTLDGDLV
jgi:hypothetical protein